MILETVHNEVEQGGIENASHSFSIKHSAKAFQILSSGLYTNKIGSIVREIGTNALDAHKMSGKNSVPFYVQLPTIVEPNFAIRDFGTGMSEDDIYEIYSTYFSSTKSGSNDATGMFGLGSKSPFSYATMFSIISWFDGVKKSYIANIDQTGCPAVVKAFEEPSDEPSGISVSMAVKIADISVFQKEVERQYEFFSPHPETNIPVNFVDKTYLVRTPTFGVRKEVSIYGIKSRAIQGSIAYPIEGLGFDNTVDLFMPMGSIEPSASRESLSLTPSTTKALKDAYKVVVDTFFQESKLRLNDCTTVLEAVQLIMTEFSKNSLLQSYGLEKYYGTYKHVTLSEATLGFWTSDWKDITIEVIQKSYTDKHFVYRTHNGYGDEILPETKPFLSYFYGNHNLFYTDDLKTSGRFIKRFLAQKNNTKLIMVTGAGTEAFYKHFNIIPAFTSSLKELYPDTKKSYMASTLGKFRTISASGCTDDRDSRPEEFVYVVTAYKKPVKYQDYRFNHVISCLGLIGDTTPIFTSRKEDAEGTELSVYLAEKIEQIGQDRINQAFSTEHYTSTNAPYNELATNKNVPVDVRRKAAAICRMKDTQENQNLRKFVMAVIELTGKTICHSLDTLQDQNKMMKDFMDRYPLLQLADSYSVRRHTDQWGKYIALIERIAQLDSEANMIHLLERKVA